MSTGDKAPGAFRTIGELSQELGVAQHILRYWETKFPQLRPLQRAGNRRYYRPADVDLARRIHRLLNQEGYTVRGVQQLLRIKHANGTATESELIADAAIQTPPPPPSPQAAPPARGVDLEPLIALRDRLAGALED